jgi:hypothetical protein
MTQVISAAHFMRIPPRSSIHGFGRLGWDRLVRLAAGREHTRAVHEHQRPAEPTPDREHSGAAEREDQSPGGHVPVLVAVVLAPGGQREQPDR